MAVTLNPSSISTNKAGTTNSGTYFYFDIVFSVVSASNGTAIIKYELWWKATGDNVNSSSQADPYTLKFSITNNGNRKVNLSENPWYSYAIKTNGTEGAELKSGTFTLDKNSKSFSFNFSSYIYDPIADTCKASGTVGIEGLVTAELTLKFDPNGGTNAPANIKIKSGESAKIPTQKPTKTGYNFQGWSTKKNGSVIYKGGDEYKFNGTTDNTVTLYAVWKIIQCEVTFDFNGGKNNDNKTSVSQMVDYGKDATPPAKSTFSYSGHTFNKWSGDYTGVTSDRTITAIWNINTYTVTYNPNGGTGAPAKQTKTYGQNLTLSTKEPTGKSYKVTFNANGGTINSQSTKSVTKKQTFINWKGSDGKTYKPGAVYKGNSNLTLTAQYKNPTLGTLPTPVYTFENSTKHATFTGWYTKKSGGTKATENTVITDDVNYWARYNYEVWYELPLIDYRDKSGKPHFMQVPLQTKYYDKNLTLADITPYAKNGEEVKKWNTKSNGSGNSYKSKAVYTDNAPLHLYGITGKQEFTVTFEDGYGNKVGTSKVTAGNSVSKADLKKAEDKAKASIKKLGKLNKKFAGWIGNYTKVYSNRTVIACWDASAVWIVEKTSAGLAWTPYLPDKKIID